MATRRPCERRLGGVFGAGKMPGLPKTALYLQSAMTAGISSNQETFSVCRLTDMIALQT